MVFHAYTKPTMPQFYDSGIQPNTRELATLQGIQRPLRYRELRISPIPNVRFLVPPTPGSTADLGLNRLSHAERQLGRRVVTGNRPPSGSQPVCEGRAARLGVDSDTGAASVLGGPLPERRAHARQREAAGIN